MKKSDISLKNLDLTEKVEGAAPVMGLKPTDGVIEESMVDVLFMIGTSGRAEGTRFIRVKLWSKNKAGLFSFTDLPVRGKSKDEMAKAIEKIGAALAERQITLYLDAHDPSLCAKAARKHYLELCDYLSAQVKGKQGRTLTEAVEDLAAPGFGLGMSAP